MAPGWLTVPAIRLVDPLGYLEFISLVSAARIVITDSGGVQEESTFLHVPCLTLRDNTERPVTISHGTNRLDRQPADRSRPARRSKRSRGTTRQSPRHRYGTATRRTES